MTRRTAGPGWAAAVVGSATRAATAQQHAWAWSAKQHARLRPPPAAYASLRLSGQVHLCSQALLLHRGGDAWSQACLSMLGALSTHPCCVWCWPTCLFVAGQAAAFGHVCLTVSPPTWQAWCKHTAAASAFLTSLLPAFRKTHLEAPHCMHHLCIDASRATLACGWLGGIAAALVACVHVMPARMQCLACLCGM